MKRILITKSNDILRVARTDGQKLYDLEIEHANIAQNVDSICNAEIVSIEPSLNAAFANFGSRRNGFLPLKEIAPEYFPENLDRSKRLNIKDLLFVGQKILVQVNKEERGTKGAALSTYISLAGCYLVLMPNNPKAGGISRRIEGEERDELKRILNALNIPNGMGVIVRTAGIGKSAEELQWDLDVLIQLWDSIKAASQQHGAPVLIHQERDIATRAVRDHLRQDITEILIDDEALYKKVYDYIERVRPDFLDRVKLYSDKLPLFSRFQLERQIETAYQRKVKLPSGGEIVIDRAEALIAIDVNSAQATKGGDIEETALNTNLEAADEIARQLRIRDLAGLIVVDFIDMDYEENNHKVEERMHEALRNDRARIQISHLSRFGLLEMSRQRLRPTLSEATQVVCPRCHGQGSIRNIQSQSASILHLIEETSQKKNITQIRAQVPVELATYLLNECRNSIEHIEKASDISVVIIANPYLESPAYELEALNLTGAKPSDKKALSYEMIKKPETFYQADNLADETIMEKRVAAVEDVLPEKPAPIGGVRSKPKKEGGLINWFKKLFSGEPKKEKPESPKHHHRGNRHQKPHQRRGGHGRSKQRPNRNNTERSSTRSNTNRRSPQQSSRQDRSTETRRTSNSSRSRRNPSNRRDRDTSEKKSSGARSHEKKIEKTPRREEKTKPVVAQVAQPKPKEIDLLEVKQPAKPTAPRKAHQPSTASQDRHADVHQIETVHNANITHETAAPVKRGRPLPTKQSKAVKPEEFEMIETKDK